MPLHYDVSENVATFTLDNPPVNAWTPELHKAFYDAYVDFLQDDNVHVGILTSAGHRAFSAGDDIKSDRPEWSDGQINQRYLNGMRESDELGYPGWEIEVLDLPRRKPIIAAINGPVLGQGLVYMCRLTDIRVAAENAKFGLKEIEYGMGGAGGAIQLGDGIAYIDAMYLALTGDLVDAHQAHQMRLINEIVPLADLKARTWEIATRIASHPRMAVMVEMEASREGASMSPRQAGRYAGSLYRLLRSTQGQHVPLKDE